MINCQGSQSLFISVNRSCEDTIIRSVHRTSSGCSIQYQFSSEQVDYTRAYTMYMCIHM